MVEPGRAIRCAIYTRKSSEEGLEQDFNSLHAQREACEAYIASQKHEGWQMLPIRYDDGGYSGGSLERPGLVRLLADITSNKVDVVVVYKVDRLTRSLTDFAKIVDVFDSNGASFVSVTQSFNTTTSMGRLTLNVLLSFAQFEREVTGERIRDKIAASKKKGLWMGGHVPIGYDASGRTLLINAVEAETVRTIYCRYLDLRSVDAVKEELDRQSRRTKIKTTGSGGHAFSRGHIYRILNNPIYVGQIRHKAVIYDGRHPAIIERAVWGRVQELLAANLQGQRLRYKSRNPSVLAGLLFDQAGRALLATHAVKLGVRYRYYVSPERMKLRAKQIEPGANPGLRLPATDVENAIIRMLAKLLRDRDWLNANAVSVRCSLDQQQAIAARAEQLAGRLTNHDPAIQRDAALTLLQRAELTADQIHLTLRPSALRDTSDDRGTPIIATRPAELRHRGVETRLIIEAAEPQLDPALINGIAQAHRWWRDLVDQRYATMRDIAHAYQTDERYVARVIALAFLPAQITKDILAGTQQIEMTLHDLLLGEAA